MSFITTTVCSRRDSISPRAISFGLGRRLAQLTFGTMTSTSLCDSANAASGAGVIVASIGFRGIRNGFFARTACACSSASGDRKA